MSGSIKLDGTYRWILRSLKVLGDKYSGKIHIY